jgi:hypothetical protein
VWSRIRREEAGQATIEWTGLVLLVSVLGLALVVAGVRLPGASLAEELAKRLVCAAGLEVGSCLEAEPRLVAAYGPEVASRAAEHAPRIEYEHGMQALPVDFRRCRRDPCSLGPASGPVSRSAAGEPVTLSTHVVDCRPGALPQARERGYDCSGERRGHLYLQLWAYYPGSATGEGSIAPGLVRGLSDRIGSPSHHPDDWESYQLRLDGPRGDARASSHHGYNYAAGLGSWLSDLGLVERAAWGRDRGRYYVSGGSHAGHVWEPSGASEHPLRRWTPARRIRLVPLERLASRAGHRWRFAVTPPWRKRVWRDPEHRGTD